jgi:Helix-turn-helix domain
MAEEPTEAHGEDAASTTEPVAAIPDESGWVTTEVAAAALRVSPRTVRDYIRSGDLKAKSEGEGVTKRWLVSIDAVQALRDKRSAAGELPRGRRDTAVGDLIAAANAVDIGELVAAVRDLEHRLGRAEARAELTERAESTLREERERLLSDLTRERERAAQEQARAEEVQRDAEQFIREREEAQEEARRLREELEAERSKGFWRRLFGG